MGGLGVGVVEWGIRWHEVAMAQEDKWAWFLTYCLVVKFRCFKG